MSSRESRILKSVVDEKVGAVRLDKYLSDYTGIGSRSQIKGMILSARVNGKSAKLAKKVNPGDSLEIEYLLPVLEGIEPEDIPLSIVYEDDQVLVVDKPQGMVVHPAHGHHSGTLVQGLLYHCEWLKERFEGSGLRPGIVHRLDKDTSGVIITAKNPRAHEELSSQFRSRRVKKRYVALIKGRLPSAEGRIDYRITRDPKNRKRFTFSDSRGKPALTRFKVLHRFGDYSLVLLAPKTGRTHQLRVHMLSQNAPILGDPIYGRKDSRFPDARLMLHAVSLEIRLPGETEPRKFTAPLPKRFRDVISLLRGS